MPKDGSDENAERNNSPRTEILYGRTRIQWERAINASALADHAVSIFFFYK